MRKEWILTDEEKYLKREKIVRNRMLKQQAQIVVQRKSIEVCFFLPEAKEKKYFL